VVQQQDPDVERVPTMRIDGLDELAAGSRRSPPRRAGEVTADRRVRALVVDERRSRVSTVLGATVDAREPRSPTVNSRNL
jgi:hypothetical protein